jgi:tetratricopeptide (TPR) repeat protein
MVRAAADRALAIDPLSAAAHGALAKYYGTLRETPRANARSSSGTARRAEFARDAIAARGYGLAGVGRREEALHELERAATLDPRNAERWISIAFIHQVARDLPAAQTAAERATAVAPTEPTFYVWRAWLHLMQDRRDSARAVLREAIEQAGVNPVLFRIAQHSAWVDMIRILHDDLGEPAARLTWKEFGLDSIDYYEAKARAYGMGSARSRTYFDSIVAWSVPRTRLATRDPSYRLAMAFGHAGAGRRDDAARALRLLEGAENFSMGGIVLARTAQACVMMGDFDRAVGYIARALADSVEPYYTPAMFRLDPIWDPLRERADFRKLIAQR